MAPPAGPGRFDRARQRPRQSTRPTRTLVAAATPIVYSESAPRGLNPIIQCAQPTHSVDQAVMPTPRGCRLLNPKLQRSVKGQISVGVAPEELGGRASASCDLTPIRFNSQSQFLTVTPRLCTVSNSDSTQAHSDRLGLGVLSPRLRPSHRRGTDPRNRPSQQCQSWVKLTAA